MAVGHTNPVLAADLFPFRGVEEMGHHRAIVERGFVIAQRLDFTGAGGVPKLYQAPWNLGALPGAFGPAGGSFVSIVASQWVQVQ